MLSTPSPVPAGKVDCEAVIRCNYDEVSHNRWTVWLTDEVLCYVGMCCVLGGRFALFFEVVCLPLVVANWLAEEIVRCVAREILW